MAENETTAEQQTETAAHDHAGHDHEHDHDHAHDHQHGPSLNPELTREVAVEVPADEVSRTYAKLTKRYQKQARLPDFARARCRSR